MFEAPRFSGVVISLEGVILLEPSWHAHEQRAQRKPEHRAVGVRDGART